MQKNSTCQYFSRLQTMEKRLAALTAQIVFRRHWEDVIQYDLKYGTIQNR